MNSYLLIFGAGLLAGTMNALSGGGSFITLPALISSGLPSVQANASSTVGLFPGTAASTWAYREGLGPIGAVQLRPLLLVTLAGGAIGAFMLLRTPTKIFDFLLPWLLLIATLTLTFGRQLGDWLRRGQHIAPPVVLTLQFALGIYGGYFGGAIGIMMMALWGLLDSRDLKSLNAPRTLLVTAERHGGADFHRRPGCALAGDSGAAGGGNHRRLLRRGRGQTNSFAGDSRRDLADRQLHHRGIFRPRLRT